MDALTDDLARAVVWMKSAQVGATEVLNNGIGYVIELDPGPTLVIDPTLEMASAWSKERLQPMLRDTPSLRGRIADPRSRHSDNTILHKAFPGGHLTIAGANSPASLASRPIRFLFCDEVDKYPASAGAAGDPISLARKRLTAFANSKEYYASTPLKKGESRIEALFETSDQCHYYVPCPECGEFQRLVWGQLRWKRELEDGTLVWANDKQHSGRGKHRPHTAIYLCEFCGAEVQDYQKGQMLAAGEWRPSEEFHGVRGFHISELYSPFTTWDEMVANFVEAKRLPDTLKEFVNEALGESWEEPGDDYDPDELKARRENYRSAPLAVLCVTAGVDLQDDRLEAEVVGWGPYQESWGLGWRQFLGDPTMPDVWNELDEFLRTPIEREDGRQMPIQCAIVDSGHHTDDVYRFTKPRFRRRVFAIKGVAGHGAGVPIIGRISRNNKRRCPFIPVNVDQCKDRVFRWLAIDEHGPGFMHFPSTYDEEYFYQLTGERRVQRIVNGQRVRAYKQMRARNEALDLRVYNICALEILNPKWDRLTAKVSEPPEAEAERTEEPPPNTGRRRPRPRSKRGGWTTNW